MNQELTMTFADLKAIVADLEKQNIDGDTKIFIDTGWDSLQELSKDAIKPTEARPFQIQDELTKEFYGGYVRESKKETKETTGEVENIFVIEHFY